MRTIDQRPCVLKIPIVQRDEDCVMSQSGERRSAMKYEHQIIQHLNEKRVEGVVQAVELLNFRETNILVLQNELSYLSLSELMLQPRFQRGMSLYLFFMLANQLIEIVSNLHNLQIMHKDISGNHILIDLDISKVILVDFGLSTTFPKQNIKNSVLQGTIPYCSPEQTGLTSYAVDHRTDLYNLGVVFYLMLTGKLPFNHVSRTVDELVSILHSIVTVNPVEPNVHDPTIPLMLSQICSKLLSKNPKDRYQSAYALKNDFQKLENLMIVDPYNKDVKFDLCLNTAPPKQQQDPFVNSMNSIDDINYSLSRLAHVDISKKYQAVRHLSPALLFNNACVFHWFVPFQECVKYCEEGYQDGIEAGCFLFTGYSMIFRVSLLQWFLSCVETSAELHRMLDDNQRILKDQMVAEYLTGMRLINDRMMIVDHEEMRHPAEYSAEEMQYLSDVEKISVVSMALYLIQKAKSQFFLGSSLLARRTLEQVTPHLPFIDGFPDTVWYRFIYCLSLLDQFRQRLDEEQYKKDMNLVNEHESYLQNWAAKCPDNFAGILDIVAAEKRFTQMIIDIQNVQQAEQSYNYQLITYFKKVAAEYASAITSVLASSTRNDLLIGLCYELYARFWHKILHDYGHYNFQSQFISSLSLSVKAYEKSGALHKVHLLQREFFAELSSHIEPEDLKRENENSLSSSLPSSTTSSIPPSPNTGRTTFDYQTDFDMVSSLNSQIKSGMSLESLLPTLMSVILTNSGAEKAILFSIGPSHNLSIDALNDRRTSTEYPSTVYSNLEISPGTLYPISVLDQVISTRQSLVHADVSTDPNFAKDPYLKRTHISSVMCLPIFYHERLGYIIYSDSTSKSIFTEERLSVCHSIAQQAATALEHASCHKKWTTNNSDLEIQLKERTSEFESTIDLFRAANQSKSIFLASMSHEIRTPMNAMIAACDLLLQSFQDITDDQREIVSIVKKCGDSLLSLIDDILDLSKIEAGKLELDNTKFSLIDCVEMSMDIVSFAAVTKGVNLMYYVEGDVPSIIQSDQTRLRQVLGNLLSNAVKFTQQGHVVLNVRRENQNVLKFSVEDSGIGIPLQTRSKLFHPFSQVSPRSFGGTGLGLMISRQLVELMGGQIWIQDDRENGSTFVFTITVGNVKSDPVSNFLKRGPTIRKRNVLVIHAEFVISELIAKLISQTGSFKSECVTSVSDAAVKLRNRAPDKKIDLILVDYHCLIDPADTTTLQKCIEDYSLNHQPKVVLLRPVLLSVEKFPIPQFAESVCFVPIRYRTFLDQLITTDQKNKPRLGSSPTNINRTKEIQKNQKIFANEYPIHILVAEDNEINQKVLGRVLNSLGYLENVHYQMASNGENAFRSALKQVEVGNPFSLILMDIWMPICDGIQCTQLIRRSSAIPERLQPYIVALTASVSNDDVKLCHGNGMDLFISKPIRLEALKNSIIKAYEFMKRSSKV